MYYMQTLSEPAETLKDFKKRKFILASFFILKIRLNNVALDGYDDNLDLVSSRTERS